ncbi:hypothetical protein EVAR_91530_1 [Eumeta japonica]|uniref:Uncharacterized protein n=1 Tax=Eumeta variegata TaxID=151549 RepID=A0A4C1VBI1_EUMVA|nr:hypothetical protein EVAR_91530_1 [Eumeta japonica]
MKFCYTLLAVLNAPVPGFEALLGFDKKAPTALSPPTILKPVHLALVHPVPADRSIQTPFECYGTEP